MALQHSQLPQT